MNDKYYFIHFLKLIIIFLFQIEFIAIKINWEEATYEK